MKRKWVRVLGTSAVLVFAMNFSVMAEEGVFVSGTKVNGIEIGGLTEAEARTKLEQSYTDTYQLSVLGRGGKKEVITGAEIGYHAVVPENLKEVLAQMDTGEVQAGPQSSPSYQISFEAAYDDALMTERIQKLWCMTEEEIPTMDAYVSSYQKGQPFTIVPEVVGTTLDPAMVEASVKAAAAAGFKEADLEIWGCYQKVTKTKEDPELKKLCDALNIYRRMSITYQSRDWEETLDGETIASWLVGVEIGQPSVDPAKAAAYVAALAAKYDTSGTERTFLTAYGTEKNLTGPYGWKINQAAETAALIQMISTGQTQAREPQYASKPASETGAEWGTTYVEIDLSAQHVFMFQNGEMVWESPCVTGNVSKDYTTPEGLYSLNYKQKDRVLRGKKQPDGSYEYESPVSYWMPFNGGIGLHDASWRSAFGGDIYLTGGSHGCINLPVDRAGLLYDLVYPGIPVICYN